jgi:membrane protein YqaA with SNARE-associated domain
MLIDFFQVAIRKHSGHASRFAHFGPCGLFFLAVLDSSPVPTFGGLDIVLAILVGTHRSPWYLCAALATAGSVLGAYITFIMARRAGSSYLQTRFGNCKLSAFLNIFEKWGTGALAASTAIPFPFPTSLFFAAAGASPYRTRTFLMVVTVCRGARYSVVAMLAYHYGRQFIHVIRHPALYWGWLFLFAVAIAALILLSALLNKRLETAPTRDAVPAM